MLKEKRKEDGDRKRRAGYLGLAEGEKVYVKEIRSTFNPTPHIVEKSTGGDVTSRNEETGKTVRKNVIKLKRVEGEWKILSR